VGAEVPAFLNSNVVLYALGDADQKRARALDLLAGEPWISTQGRERVQSRAAPQGALGT
jgi:predicted nucleic acid-binding protein